MHPSSLPSPLETRLVPICQHENGAGVGVLDYDRKQGLAPIRHNQLILTETPFSRRNCLIPPMVSWLSWRTEATRAASAAFSRKAWRMCSGEPQPPEAMIGRLVLLRSER